MPRIVERLSQSAWTGADWLTRHPWVLLPVLAGLALALRVFRVGKQSLWYDEAFSLTVARLPLDQMKAHILAESPDHPPLYYYLLHGWMALVGFGDVQARLLSGVIGMLMVLALYGFGSYVMDRQTGLIAALLATFSQVAIMYSQEARSYSLLMLLAVVTAYLFIRALESRSRVTWIGFSVTSAALCLSHYLAVPLLAALWCYGIALRTRLPIPRTWLVVWATVVIGGLLAWLSGGTLETILGHEIVKAGTQEPQAPWFQADLWSIAEVFNTFNNANVQGVMNWAPLPASLAGFAVVTAPALYACLGAQRKETAIPSAESALRVYVLVIFAVPVMVIVGLGLMQIKYNVRYLVYCAPAYYILVAMGLRRIRSHPLRLGMVAVAIGLSILSLRSVYSLPYKENYRDALAWMAAQYAPSDCTMFLPFSTPPLEWAIYHGGDVRLHTLSLDELVASPDRCPRLWLVGYRRVPSAEELVDDGRRIVERTHRLGQERSFFWVSVHLYSHALSTVPPGGLQPRVPVGRASLALGR